MKNIIATSVLLLSGIGISTAQTRFASVNSTSSSVAANSYTSSNTPATREAPHTVTTQHVNTANTPAPATFPKPANNTVTTHENSYQGITASPASGGMNVPVTGSVVMQRYNHVTKHALPYYSTAATKYKSLRRVNPIVKRKHHQHICAPALYFAEYFLSYTCGYAYDYPGEDDIPSVMDNPVADNSIYNGSFDGFVVYGNDTLSGIITPAKNIIVLEEPLGDMQELAGVYNYDDKQLKMVAIFEGNRELYLSRPTVDGKLMRTIHAGKLSIYDDHYSFLTTDNVSKAKLTLVYNGAVTTSKTFLATSNKQLVTDYVNKAYSLNLNATDFTWKKLLLYIDKLD